MALDPAEFLNLAWENGVLPSDTQNVIDQVENAIPGVSAVKSVVANVTTAKNIIHDLGPFALGLGLLLVGGLMLAFSWGEQIADALERTASVAAKVAPVAE